MGELFLVGPKPTPGQVGGTFITILPDLRSLWVLSFVHCPISAAEIGTCSVPVNTGTDVFSVTRTFMVPGAEVCLAQRKGLYYADHVIWLLNACDCMKKLDLILEILLNGGPSSITYEEMECFMFFRINVKENNSVSIRSRIISIISQEMMMLDDSLMTPTIMSMKYLGRNQGRKYLALNLAQLVQTWMLKEMCSRIRSCQSHFCNIITSVVIIAADKIQYFSLKLSDVSCKFHVNIAKTNIFLLCTSRLLMTEDTFSQEIRELKEIKSDEEYDSAISYNEDITIETESVTEVREILLNSTIKEEEEVEGGEWYVQKGRRRKSQLVLNVSTSDSSGGDRPATKRERIHNDEVLKMATGSAGGGNANLSSGKRKCWALAAENFPDAELKKDDFDIILEHLSQKRRGCKVNGVKVMTKIVLDDVVLENGVIKIWFLDGFTENWLKTLSFDIHGVSANLKWLDYSAGDALVYCTIKIKIRKTPYDTIEFKEQLEESNSGLVIKIFDFVRKKAMADGVHQLITFKVDEAAATFFENAGGKVRFDLMKTFVNVLRENQNKRQKLDAV